MDRKDFIKNRILQTRKKRILSIDEYVSGIKDGSRVMLGRAITLIESTRAEHQALAREVVDKCLPFSGNSFRLGITGVPGVGKSTFIETLGMHVLEKGHKLAVLAIDPTSNLSRGSILGDKTRMQHLSVEENAFIRPSPAGDSLGGVARKTREVATLCEAGGYDTVFIETVGVGQSETAVHSMTDFFLLLLLPGGGDELQGIKRGIVEMADMIAVNKADSNPIAAKQAKQAYRNAVHLFPAKESKWTVKTHLCSALQGDGISHLWQEILSYQSFSKENGYFHNKRKQQAVFWLKDTIGNSLLEMFRTHPKVMEKWDTLIQAVEEGAITPFAAAEVLLGFFREK
ncbi:MAG: methylmalonyl Co-A mutase-associated GTPase MeaB [Saprospiraceae bacterium]